MLALANISILMVCVVCALLHKATEVTRTFRSSRLKNQDLRTMKRKTVARVLYIMIYRQLEISSRSRNLQRIL
jgi:hypothetical protein